ncbi:alpha/beta hydrolase-fold protein [Bacillus sp. 31A1R]|uniref:Alpha/beta hydrolase-fold protein n=1 Tax=Robertmurraya mangrovi TaxID=3098077 RepID=A0ABU5IVW5_9BACI|nr:alpha/beta hydrolase-fold protein [Bacillus sp. 31A1R]MDZ5471294.1 alpha/beta hydrolase-fold protein [Bacillus sp. 31A1R]
MRALLEKFSVHMNVFNQERIIRVYLPVSYQEGENNYPVLYMHDGQNVFDDSEAIGGVSLKLKSYLDKNELDVIVVVIDQNSEERFNEYSPWVDGEYVKKLLGQASSLGGKGKQYMDFIVHELKPLIDEKYRTKKDYTAMAGISLGGLITTYAACKYPEIFKHIIIFSSAFYRNQEDIENLIKESDLSLIESFYMDCGTREGGESENDNICREFLTTNQRVYNILREKLPTTRFEIIKNASHGYVYFKERRAELFTFVKKIR